MRARRIAAFVVALALPLAACANSSDSGAAADTPPSLAGTAWDLTQYAPAGASELAPVPEGVTPTAEFTADQVSGSGGCNRFTGGYTTDGDTITFGPLASTQIACEGDAGTVEADYFARLGEAKTYAVKDKTLTFSDSAGTVVLSYTEAVPVTLTNTTWSATGINNGKEAVTSLVAGSTITAEFSEDGTLSGNAGCNMYNGTYEVSGDSMTIGPLATTKKACEPDVNEQEANYLAALTRVTKYTIRGDQLELRDDGGALQAGYTAG